MPKCTRPLKGLIYCGLHRSRFYKYGDANISKSDPCFFPDCPAAGKTNGLCREHVVLADESFFECTETNCVKPYYGNGLCRRHWRQVNDHGKVLEHTVHDYRPAIIEGDIAKIPLGVGARDGYAIVDKKWAWLDKYKWIRRKKGPRSNGYYAFAVIDRSVSITPTPMHRLIANTPDGLDTDHRDNDGLNNRESNLRPTDRTQNNYNTGVRVNNTSGVRGVAWFKPAKLWRAYIGGTKTRIELGYFKNFEDAVKARLEAEKEIIDKV